MAFRRAARCRRPRWGAEQPVPVPGLRRRLVQPERPDAFTTLDDSSDCWLLDQFFSSLAGASFTAAQRQEVAGFPSYESCQDWDTYFGDLVTASGACAGTATPQPAWWSAANPDGVKCSMMESYASQFGRNPATGATVAKRTAASSQAVQAAYRDDIDNSRNRQRTGLRALGDEPVADQDPGGPLRTQPAG